MEKSITDPIHGEVFYPKYVFDIIDTAEFQRLRNLKQLGLSYKVFPGGVHTRFEHCLGVCHLSNVLMTNLERNSKFTINDIHRKCVMIAGLLHDIGHGPFSHMWESFVRLGSQKDWCHEQTSCDMVEHIITTYNIKLSEEEYEHLYAVKLITSLISGDLKVLETLLTPDLMFLSEIVNNKFCEIDVDKWDYILRDSYYLKNCVKTSTDFGKFFKDARITKVDKISHISYNEADYGHIYQLFENRFILHKECYQNTTVAVMERMLIAAFLEAEKCGFTIKGLKLSEAHLDLDVYKYLDDTIVNFIDITDSFDMNESKNIIKRLKERKIYKNIYKSSEWIDLDALNKKFGNFFIQIHQKIPHAGVTMPKVLILHDGMGNIVCPDFRGNEMGCFEQYLVYCTNDSDKVIETSRTFLEESYKK